MARAKADQNAAILEYALHHLERERDENSVQRSITCLVNSVDVRTPLFL